MDERVPSVLQRPSVPLCQPTSDAVVCVLLSCSPKPEKCTTMHNNKRRRCFKSVRATSKDAVWRIVLLIQNLGIVGGLP